MIGGHVARAVRNLESPREEVRAAALEELAPSTSLAAVKAVRRTAVADPSEKLRERARALLAALGATLGAPDATGGDDAGLALPGSTSEAFARKLADTDPLVRAEAARVLALSLDPGVPALIVAALARETDPLVIVLLIDSLVAVGGAKAAHTVGLRLSHADPRVRARAVLALAATGDPGVLPRLVDRLHDDHPDVRAAAAEALAAHEPETVTTVVDRLLLAKDEAAVRSGLFLLRYLAPPAALSRLAPALARRAPDVKRMALRSLVSIARDGSTDALEMLARVAPAAGVEDPGDDLALMALRTLGVDPAPVLPEAGEPSSGDLVSIVRAFDAASGAVPEAGGLAVLLSALADPDPHRASDAARALSRVPAEKFRAAVASKLASAIEKDRAEGLVAARFVALPDRIALLARGHADAARVHTLAVAAAAGHRARVHEVLAVWGAGPAKDALASRLAGLDSAASASVGAGTDSSERMGSHPLLTLASEGQLTIEDVRTNLPGQKDPVVAARLLDALGSIQTSERVALAAPFATDPDPRVRLAALAVLDSDSGSEATGALTLMVQDSDLDVGRRALGAVAARAGAAGARDAVRPLVLSGRARAVRRGLELLEELDDPGALPLVLDVLRRPVDPGAVLLVERLVLAFANDETPVVLAELHARAWPMERELIRSISLALGRARGLPGREVDLDLARAARPPESPAVLAAMPERPARGVLAVPLVAIALVSILLTRLLFGSFNVPPEMTGHASLETAGGKPGGRGWPAVSTAVPPRLEHRLPVWSVAPVRSGGSVADVLADALAGTRRPTVEELAGKIARRLAARGITHRRLARVAALARLDLRHDAALAAADAGRRSGDTVKAAAKVEAALGELPPDHLVGRVELLRALARLYQRANDRERTREAQVRLAAAEKAYLALFTEAVRGEVGLGPLHAELAREQGLRDSSRRVAEVLGARE